MSTHAKPSTGRPAAVTESPGSRRRSGDGLAGLVAAFLVICTALPTAVLVVPSTLQHVLPVVAEELRLAGSGLTGALRADGLALPVLLLVVPPAGLLTRRVPAWTVLLGGLCCVLAGGLAAGYADSVSLIATARVLQGLGAGLILPATLVVAWERGSPFLMTFWAGTLTASLLVATPLALRAVPDQPADGGWRMVLHPYPWLPVVALAAVALGIFTWSRTVVQLPPPRHTERVQLLLPLIPAAGFAFFAVAATSGWSPGVQLMLAGAALCALLGLAVLGSRDASVGSPHGFAVVALAAGLLGYPVLTPLAGLISLNGGPGRMPLAVFAVAATAAVLAGLIGGLPSRESARGAVLSGFGAIMVALLVLLTVDAASGPLVLLPLVPLGAGIGLALATALRHSGVAASLFGLSLCFPALLTGQVLVLSLQSTQLKRMGMAAAGSRMEVLYALTAGYRIWIITAGVIAVLLAGAVLAAARYGAEPAVPTGEPPRRRGVRGRRAAGGSRGRRGAPRGRGGRGRRRETASPPDLEVRSAPRPRDG